MVKKISNELCADLARAIRVKVEMKPNDPPTLGKAPRSKLRTLVTAAGNSVATAACRRRVQEALDEEGIATLPDITEMSVGPDDLIRFFYAGSTGGLTSPEFLFDLESQLERYVRNNSLSIKELSEYPRVRRQYELTTGERIDILCFHRKKVLVVELKAGEPDNDLPSQMRRYLHGLRRDFDAKKDKRTIAGLIITGQPNPKIHADVLQRCEGFNVEWKLYRRQFFLEDPPRP